jgi:hypothetical protein
MLLIGTALAALAADGRVRTVSLAFVRERGTSRVLGVSAPAELPRVTEKRK